METKFQCSYSLKKFLKDSQCYWKIHVHSNWQEVIGKGKSMLQFLQENTQKAKKHDLH